MAKLNKALNEVRAEETRRMQCEWRDPVLKKSRWLLLKRSENLADVHQLRPGGKAHFQRRRGGAKQ